MKFKSKIIKSLLALSFISFSLSACGGGSDSSSNHSGSETSVVSGSLSMENASSYKVMALETSTNEATIIELDENGQFSESLDSGTYALSLMDEDNQTLALLVVNGSTIFTVDENTDFGSLTVDTDARTMTTSSSANISAMKLLADNNLDLGDLSGLGSTEDHDNGVDLSDDTLGKGDEDGDGVPDFLDNDINENGIYDSAEGFHLCAIKVIPGETEEASVLSDLRDVDCLVFDNLKLAPENVFNGDGDLNPHTDFHNIAMHVTIPLALEPYVQSIEAVSVPAYANGTVYDAAGGWTYSNADAQNTYPSTGSSWSAYDPDGDGTGYSLPLATSPDSELQYSMWLNPVGDPVPSLFTYKITTVNGTVAFLTTRLMFVFNTPPLVTKIEDDLGAITTLSYPMSDGDSGTAPNPMTINSSATELILTADRPLDHAGGTEICGMQYQAHIFYYDASNTPINVVTVMSSAESDTGTCDPSVDLEMRLDLATYLPATYDSTSVAKYKVDFTVVGANGDNSSEAFYFKY